ncbi:MAG: pyridoxamine 5'-phosphate oxidase family protein [Zhengella sp.]|uniref:HugZ family pyridoxamine 5'-phosphate oxidase n=1 Tax=Zhengella sp. TaxID=2282762 RepID=UPI001DED7933|nr:HugZ family protein [Notoacmeibacter sp.]MCC0027588.1 HugZ family protein [Brucellaceae bacterium]
MTEKRSDPVRPADDEARALARRLMRAARHGALGVVDPDTGGPHVSRVGLATMVDGTPLILVSSLAGHTAGLAADPRCSLLIGEPGKGDPLAHPRMTMACHARKLDSPGAAADEARIRYLAANPKAALYVDFGDFSFYALAPRTASLNGGFGRAWRLTARDLLCDREASARFAAAQAGLLEWLNGQGLHALTQAARSARLDGHPVKAAGVDPAGIDIVLGPLAARLDFIAPATQPDQVAALVERAAAKP